MADITRETLDALREGLQRSIAERQPLWEQDRIAEWRRRVRRVPQVVPQTDHTYPAPGTRFPDQDHG